MTCGQAAQRQGRGQRREKRAGPVEGAPPYGKAGRAACGSWFRVQAGFTTAGGAVPYTAVHRSVPHSQQRRHRHYCCPAKGVFGVAVVSLCESVLPTASVRLRVTSFPVRPPALVTEPFHPACMFLFCLHIVFKLESTVQQ